MCFVDFHIRKFHLLSCFCILHNITLKMNILKNNVSTFLKGFAMGTANVIPGVSGGTIALIMGIFERLIDSLKSFNMQAIKMLLKRD